jgi:hypothetical protein
MVSNTGAKLCELNLLFEGTTVTDLSAHKDRVFLKKMEFCMKYDEEIVIDYFPAMNNVFN